MGNYIFGEKEPEEVDFTQRGDGVNIKRSEYDKYIKAISQKNSED